MAKKNTSSKFRLLLTGQLVKSKNTRGIQDERYSKKNKKQVNVENQAINLLSKEELNKKI